MPSQSAARHGEFNVNSNFEFLESFPCQFFHLPVTITTCLVQTSVADSIITKYSQLESTCGILITTATCEPYMTTVSNGARPYPKVSTLGSYQGGALPVIMSIIGPQETHDYRNYNLLVRGTNTSQNPPKKLPFQHKQYKCHQHSP